MSRKLYLDLDGVMADFDRHFFNLFGMAPSEAGGDAVMWSMIESKPAFFLDLPLCESALEFFSHVHGLNPIVLTSCPKGFYTRAAAQKRAWVYLHLGPEVMVLPILGGYNKPLFMHAPGDVLVDDYGCNVGAWVRAGGIGIKHENFISTVEALENIVW